MPDRYSLAVRLAALYGCDIEDAEWAIDEAVAGNAVPCRRFGVMLVRRRGDEALDVIDAQLADLETRAS